VQRRLCMIDGLFTTDPFPDLPACAGCGKCCHLLVELRLGVDDVPEELVVEHDGVPCMDQHGDGACVALDRETQLCTIYARRPQTCRDFNRGESLCRRAVSGRRGSLAPLDSPRSS
jgi:uncharacterized protein